MFVHSRIATAAARTMWLFVGHFALFLCVVLAWRRGGHGSASIDAGQYPWILGTELFVFFVIAWCLSIAVRCCRVSVSREIGRLPWAPVYALINTLLALGAGALVLLPRALLSPIARRLSPLEWWLCVGVIAFGPYARRVLAVTTRGVRYLIACTRLDGWTDVAHHVLRIVDAYHLDGTLGQTVQTACDARSKGADHVMIQLQLERAQVDRLRRAASLEHRQTDSDRAYATMGAAFAVDRLVRPLVAEGHVARWFYRLVWLYDRQEITAILDQVDAAVSLTVHMEMIGRGPVVYPVATADKFFEVLSIARHQIVQACGLHTCIPTSQIAWLVFEAYGRKAYPVTVQAIGYSHELIRQMLPSYPLPYYEPIDREPFMIHVGSNGEWGGHLVVILESEGAEEAFEAWDLSIDQVSTIGKVVPPFRFPVTRAFLRGEEDCTVNHAGILWRYTALPHDIGYTSQPYWFEDSVQMDAIIAEATTALGAVDPLSRPTLRIPEPFHWGYPIQQVDDAS